MILLFSAVALFATVSCKKTTEGQTGTTYYPVITLLGDELGIIAVGEEYQDPGCEAIMNGEDVTSQVVISSDIDNTKPGINHITYTVTNEQGFSASAVREVWVYAPSSFANLYESEIDLLNGKVVYGGPMLISEIQPGVYEVPDICGGYYSYYRYPGYPYDFNAEVYATLGADGTITPLGGAEDWYFADPADPSTMSDGKYDSATGEITWNMCFSGEPFLTVKLTPVTK